MLFLQLSINALINGSIYGLFAIGLVILFKSSTILNFSHGEFFMLSAFLALTFYTSFHLPYALSIIFSVILLFFLGASLNKLIFQKMINAPHISVVMITIGISSFLKGASRVMVVPG